MNIRHTALRAAAAALVISSFGAIGSVQASDKPFAASEKSDPAQGSIEAWKRAKFPWMYPTPTEGHNLMSAPPLTQQQTWERIKFPQRYATAPIQSEPVISPEPLSQMEIWKRAKFPWNYNADGSPR